MRLDHIDYTKLVIADFKRKQQDSERPLLPTFTRASIRQECLKVYTERLNKGKRQEIPTLRKFFGVPLEGDNFASLIKECPLDDFRPLENLMKNKIKSPVFANVELLAWLIDFKHRPYSTGMNVLLNEEELAILKKSKAEPDDSALSAMEPRERGIKSEERSKAEKPGGNKSPIILAGLLLAVTMGGGYTFWKDKSAKQPIEKVNTGCMYWADDHYEQVPCSEVKHGRLVLPMNEEKMKNFKKIMRPDTITTWSIGKIYYLKKNNIIEYFTGSGNHPVETNRELKKLTHYMFDKHLSKKGTTNDGLMSKEDAKLTNNR